MTIEIPRQIDKQDYLLVVAKNMLDKHNANYSEDLLGEYKTSENIEKEYKDMSNDSKIRIPLELHDEINLISEDEVKQYIDKHKSETRGYDNNFTHIMAENQDIFDTFLTKDGQKTYNKTNCKELLKESIKVYKTKYNDELYIKTDSTHFKHIGNCYEDIYQYYENMYQDTPRDLQRFIPFSSFFNRSSIKHMTFESLEPNRHIILFDDCILDVSNGKVSPYETITRDSIPFSVIDGRYKQKNERCYTFVTDLINKLVKEPNILKSILYSLVNKDELVKSAIFNIQASGKGKTKLLDPFKQIGILITAQSETLKHHLEIETIYKQKLIVNFEEIQDAIIQGSDFNNLIDDSAITVPRKNRTAIDVPAYVKPAIIINGEDLPDFKGRTRGTLNRFSLMPIWIDEITEDEAEFIKANGHQIGIEMLRYLVLFMMNTTKTQRKEWLLTCKITEQQYLELRESKTRTIFEYIDEAPQILLENQAYCISEKMLENMIIRLQDENILTVNLFNNESNIKKFIKDEIIKGLEIDTANNEYMTSFKRTTITKTNGIRETHRLKYCLQLTKKGQDYITKMNYDIEKLRM